MEIQLICKFISSFQGFIIYQAEKGKRITNGKETMSLTNCRKNLTKCRYFWSI